MTTAEALRLIDDHDVLTAVATTSSGDDPAAAMRAFADVTAALYWERRDLARCVAVSWAGMQFGLARAADVEPADPAMAADLRGRVKGLCYNLASFAWPGWDEAGITIGPGELALGHDAARANLRLARELGKGELPLCRAWWMLAGHRLAAGDRVGAAEGYAASERHAVAAVQAAEEALARAFKQLVAVLDGSAAADTLAREAEALQSMGPDGVAFAGQVETAHRVFGRRQGGER